MAQELTPEEWASIAEMGTPFERAAYRTRESVRPFGGRAGEGPTVPDVLMSAAPIGRIAQGIGRAITAAPRTAAAVLGIGGAMLPNEAQAQQGPRDTRLDAIDKLNADIVKNTNMLVRQGNRQYPSKEARQNAAKPFQDAITAAREQIARLQGEMSTERSEAARLEREGKADTERTARAAAEEKRLAERPLVEKYPVLTYAPLAGGALAGAFAYSPRMRAALAHNEYVKRMMDAVAKAEKATIRSPTAKGTERIVQQVEEAQAGYPAAAAAGPGAGVKVGSALAGGLVAGELGLAPYQIDIRTQPPESAAGRAAAAALDITSPEAWSKFGWSALTGLTGSTIGSTAPVFPRRMQPDMPRAGAVVREFRERPANTQISSRSKTSRAQSVVQTPAGQGPTLGEILSSSESPVRTPRVQNLPPYPWD